jgi:hypothetical protein
MSAEVTTESGDGVFSEDRFRYEPVTTTSSIVSSATAYVALPKASTIAAQKRLLLRKAFLLRSRIIVLPCLFDTPLPEPSRSPKHPVRATDYCPKLTRREIKESINRGTA